MTEKDLLDVLLEEDAFVHVAAAGGGTELAQLLSQRPGASSWLSGLSYPYDQEETRSLIGFEPKSYVSMDVAIELAMYAYMKAYRFGSEKTPIGVGLEAAIASSKPHRGDHRIHACVIAPGIACKTTLILDKGIGQKARIEDNAKCSYVVWKLLSAALGSNDCQYDDVEGLTNETMLEMILEHPYIEPSGQRHATPPTEKILMPGAYNPPHNGHFGIANNVKRLAGLDVVHHLTIDSPHKPTLIAQEVLERMKLLKGHHTLITRGDPMFIQKAERFPGTPIVVGTDALTRLFDPLWGLPIAETLEKFRQLGTTFYVSERPTQLSDKMSPSKLTLNRVLSDANIVNDGMFKVVDGSWNISSSEIRNATLSSR